MLKIGLIDSGVSLQELDCSERRVEGIHLYRDEQGRIRSGTGIQDRLGHGTACAWTLLRYHPGACFFVVKIFDGEPASDEGILVEAIRSCLEHDVAIINISLGIQSTRISEALFDACNEAYERNIPIIAAAHLDDKPCFPAYHPKVIGVGSLDMASPEELVYMEHMPVNFYTKGEVIFQGRQYFGTSFACPQITGEMLLLMKAIPGYNIPALIAALAAKATRAQLPFPLPAPEALHLPDSHTQAKLQAQYFQPLAKFGQMEKVLVLPLEDPAMRAISATLHPGHGHLQYIHCPHGYHPYHIPALVADELLDSFDTIALGSLLSLFSYYYYRPLCLQLQELLKRGKHFIVYHEADYQLLMALRQEIRSNSHIIYSALEKECMQDFHQFAWLPALKTPVLAVIGAGNQEVISMQENICSRLRALDYAVSYISPVMQGELIGAVFSYPVLTVEGRDEESYNFLAQLLRAVQAYHSPDLILTGLPGALTTGKRGAISAPAAFLKGIQPDALMIVVREEDPLEAVIRNYHAAIGLTGVRRCCFFLIGERDNDRLYHLQASLMPLGIVIFSGDAESNDLLERAIRSFFSLHALPGVV